MSDQEVPEYLSDENIKKLKAEDKKRNKTSKPAKKKPEPTTFNALDEKFQLTEDHEADHIFPEELLMVSELRKRLPVLQFYSDTFIVYFLCARRHDVDETETLFTRFFEVMEEFHFDKRFPSVTRQDVQEMFQWRHTIQFPDGTDKHGRPLRYMFISKSKTGTPIETMAAILWWEVDFLVSHVPLSLLRNGFIMVMDMKDFSIFKHIDTSPNGRRMGQFMSGSLPTRVRDIYVVNSGIWFRAFMQAAKLILPKKLAQRIRTAPIAELKSIIPDVHLLEKYGGTRKLSEEDFQAHFAKLAEYDKAVHKVWRDRRKQIKAWKKAQQAAIAAEAPKNH